MRYVTKEAVCLRPSVFPVFIPEDLPAPMSTTVEGRTLSSGNSGEFMPSLFSMDQTADDADFPRRNWALIAGRGMAAS